MKTCMHWVHLEHNTLSIYQSEQCFNQTLQRKMNMFYIQYTLFVNLPVFKATRHTECPRIITLLYVLSSQQRSYKHMPRLPKSLVFSNDNVNCIKI
jgi:hypothetical protein